jgi:integrase
MTEIIKNQLKKNRSQLSESSLTTYTSILTNLYKNMYDSNDYNLDKFNDSKKVITYLKTLEPNKRKTTLSALFVLTENKAYRKAMIDDINSYDNKMKKQEKSEAQEEGWVDTQEVNEIIDKLESEVKLLYKQDVTRMDILQDIQEYVLACLVSGLYVPPRRSKDMCDFKIKNITDNDNYIDKNELVYNSYKTFKTYGQQRVKMPKKLQNILKKWISINPTDYLFFDKNSNPLTNVKMNQRLNKLFGKKSGMNALRHTYLTDKYKEHSMKDKELKEDVKAMGTSVHQALNAYIKVD